MSDFPTVTPPNEISSKLFKKQKKSNFEAGYVQSYCMHTRSRSVFEMKWGQLHYTYLNLILDHFELNQGDIFYFTHPVTGISYTMRYSENEISYNPNKENPDYYEVKVNLEEV
jgi:hypothetical protein